VAEKGGINMGSRRRGKGSISKVKANISHIKGCTMDGETRIGRMGSRTDSLG
jgi:hypothetical protein